MPNALAHEKSPYLLQHAGNPVDWYPWGDAAFDAARERDVPVFLSVGYSAAHRPGYLEAPGRVQLRVQRRQIHAGECQGDRELFEQSHGGGAMPGAHRGW